MLEVKGEKDLVLFDMYPNLQIRGIDRVRDIRDKVTIVQGDVGDPIDVFRVMNKYNVDRVIHLAFNMGSYAGNDPSRWMRVNAIGTTNVFEGALQTGVKRVVYASSARVYGSEVATMYNEPLTEDVPPTPTVGAWENVYGACKLMIEMIAQVYWERHGLDVIGMRPTGTFGVGKIRGDLDSPNVEVVASLELAALGESVMLPPDDQYLDFMYAADAAEAWYLALTAENPPHRIFNMTSEARRMGEINAYMRRMLPDAKITISPQPMERLHLMSNERLRKELGFSPRYTVEEGLHEAHSRARAHAGLPPLPPL